MIKAGKETGSVAQFPSRIGLLGIDTLLQGRPGQEGAEERRHRHRLRHQGERERVRLDVPALPGNEHGAPGIPSGAPCARREVETS